MLRYAEFINVAHCDNVTTPHISYAARHKRSMRITRNIEKQRALLSLVATGVRVNAGDIDTSIKHFSLKVEGKHLLHEVSQLLL